MWRRSARSHVGKQTVWTRHARRNVGKHTVWRRHASKSEIIFVKRRHVGEQTVWVRHGRRHVGEETVERRHASKSEVYLFKEKTGREQCEGDMRVKAKWIFVKRRHVSKQCEGDSSKSEVIFCREDTCRWALSVKETWAEAKWFFCKEETCRWNGYACDELNDYRTLCTTLDWRVACLWTVRCGFNNNNNKRGLLCIESPSVNDSVFYEWSRSEHSLACFNFPFLRSFNFVKFQSSSNITRRTCVTHRESDFCLWLDEFLILFF